MTGVTHDGRARDSSPAPILATPRPRSTTSSAPGVVAHPLEGAPNPVLARDRVDPRRRLSPVQLRVAGRASAALSRNAPALATAHEHHCLLVMTAPEVTAVDQHDRVLGAVEHGERLDGQPMGPGTPAVVDEGGRPLASNAGERDVTAAVEAAELRLGVAAREGVDGGAVGGARTRVLRGRQ